MGDGIGGRREFGKVRDLGGSFLIKVGEDQGSRSNGRGPGTRTYFLPFVIAVWHQVRQQQNLV